MKTKLLLTAALGVAVGALLAVVLTQPTFAAGNILTEPLNPHNLSSTSQAGSVMADRARKCDFCHTPHGASVTAVGVLLPLWNRTDAAGPFTPYGDPQGTIDALDLDNTLGPQSMACMSCHDGAVALDSLVNFPNPYPNAGAIDFAAIAGRVNATEQLISLPTGKALDSDLSNDHPVGFTNPGPAGDPDLDAVDPVYHFTLVGDDQVECASCHQVHFWDTVTVDNQPFLRQTMADNLLCDACHDK